MFILIRSRQLYSRLSTYVVFVSHNILAAPEIWHRCEVSSSCFRFRHGQKTPYRIPDGHSMVLRQDEPGLGVQERPSVVESNLQATPPTVQIEWHLPTTPVCSHGAAYIQYGSIMTLMQYKCHRGLPRLRAFSTFARQQVWVISSTGYLCVQWTLPIAKFKEISCFV